MAGEVRHSAGRVSVTIDQPLLDQFEGIAAVAAETVRAETEAVYTKAKAGWPVATGRSKAALTWALRMRSDGVIEGTIWDPARDRYGKEYAYLINHKGEGRKRAVKTTRKVLGVDVADLRVTTQRGTVWMDLVSTPMKLARANIRAALVQWAARRAA